MPSLICLRIQGNRLLSSNKLEGCFPVGLILSQSRNVRAKAIVPLAAPILNSQLSLVVHFVNVFAFFFIVESLR